MNRTKGIALVVAFLVLGVSMLSSSTPVFTLPTCLQDQYGNQYDQLVTDPVHGLITGVVHNHQDCPNDSWQMIGSWSTNSSGQTTMEISVANATPDICIFMYKLKGPYPRADWYYTSDQTYQPFQYVACSADSAILPDTRIGGTNKLR